MSRTSRPDAIVALLRVDSGMSEGSEQVWLMDLQGCQLMGSCEVRDQEDASCFAALMSELPGD